MKFPETATLAADARAATETSHERFAALIGCGRRSPFEWEAGDKQPTRATQVLLKLIRAKRVTVKDLEAVADDD